MAQDLPLLARHDCSQSSQLGAAVAAAMSENAVGMAADFEVLALDTDRCSRFVEDRKLGFAPAQG